MLEARAVADARRDAGESPTKDGEDRIDHRQRPSSALFLEASYRGALGTSRLVGSDNAVAPLIHRRIVVNMTAEDVSVSGKSSKPATSTLFTVGMRYTRADVYEALAVPEDRRYGNWETGYNRFDDDCFIFANVGAAGRTGHDYDNAWVGEQLRWRGKGGSRLENPSIQALLSPLGETLIFWRDDNDSPFWFAGAARAARTEPTSPVTVWWEFSSTRGDERAALDLLLASRPRTRARGQGFMIDPAARRAVENHAMRRAKEHFEQRGFLVEDVHLRQPYDFLCRRDDDVLHVEVKGTSTGGEEVFLTAGEVRFARNNKMALYIVHGIMLHRDEEGCTASGGTSLVIDPWVLDEERLQPVAYSYVVMPQGST